MKEPTKNEPWIKKFNNIKELPGEFVEEFRESSDYKYLLLIPDRQDFYRYVIAVYDSFIYIIEKKSLHMLSRKIPYSEIIYLKNSQILLTGLFMIMTAQGEILIRYNTVSDYIMENLINLIREKNRLNNSTMSEIKGNSQKINCPSGVEILYKNIFNKLKNREKYLEIIAYQPEVRLTKQLKNRLLKLITHLVDIYLLSHFYLHNNNELIIISKGSTFRRGGRHSYGYAITYLPLHQILSISKKPYGIMESLIEITISLANNEIKKYFAKQNSDINQLVNFPSYFSAI